MALSSVHCLLVENPLAELAIMVREAEGGERVGGGWEEGGRAGRGWEGGERE